MPMRQRIEIIPFQKEHQTGIDSMMQTIALEFEEPIFSAQSKKIIDLFALPNNTYWVATIQGQVIGTIGMTELAHGNVVLKSMFVDQVFRGHGVSGLLLATLTNRVMQNRGKRIYLGTMTQFAAGQRFYEKNGFAKCETAVLPPDFTINPLDTVFYTKSIDHA
ncbi:GNAT family N-acetyltransferase [Flavobacterium sp.]|uniref:GNAT family N-acetyltransferase n=1 Tax=Flavobacterium sp. TaxID=239 RepID=UPI0039E468E5